MRHAAAALAAAVLCLTAVAASAAPGKTLTSVIVHLRAQAALPPPSGGDRAERLQRVIETLQAKAAATQGPVAELLEARRQQSLVTKVRAFWIFNGFAVTATPEVIAELEARPEVLRVTPDAPIRLARGSTVTAAQAAPEANIDQIYASDLWPLGYRGQGIVVASMDTGVDGTHPDLADTWRGGANSWYDPYGEHPDAPFDADSHGTMTTGIMVGGDAGGTAIGVAPEAQWIAVKLFNDAGSSTTSKAHLAFEWLLDPDENPATPDAPHVVNNSWTMGGAPGCDLEFQPDLQALRAADIVPVFAAGNGGPNASTSFSPANNPEALAVGSVDGNDVIAPSSSRGPSTCGGSPPPYPELTAPGVNIRSANLQGTYANGTGTSLAAPHVSGALALMLSAFPGFSSAEHQEVLEDSSADLGAAGFDDTYGFGRVDVLGAYDALEPDPPPDFTFGVSPASRSTMRGGSVTYTVSVGPLEDFTGDVTLSLGGAPAGTTVNFNPAMIAGGTGTSVLTVTTSNNTPAGTSTLTVYGQSGTTVHFQTVTLTVNVTVVSGFPSTVTAVQQTASGGSAASLGSDNGAYYSVSSTTKVVLWFGTISGVPNTANPLDGLRVTYVGKSSKTCTQTVAIRNFSDGGWEPLDTRSVGTADVTIANVMPGGPPSAYVSGNAGNGNVRIRVKCKATTAGLVSSGDLMQLDYVP